MEEITKLGLSNGPLSHGQNRIILDEMVRFYGKNLPIYNLSFVINILNFTKSVDELKNMIYNCLKKMIIRHEILRTRIIVKETTYLQEVISENELPNLELSSFFYQSQHEYNNLITQLSFFSYNVFSQIIQFIPSLLYSEQSFQLHILSHHSIIDGLSIPIFEKEFNSLIKNYHLESFEDCLVPLEFQYLDYSIFENNWLNTEEAEKMVIWWKSQLTNCETYCMNLPLDRIRTANRSSDGKRLWHKLTTDCIVAFKQWCKLTRLTSHIAFYAFCSLCLGYVADQNTVILGGVDGNRSYIGTEDLIGMFANTVAYKFDINWDQAVQEYIKEIKHIFCISTQCSSLPFDHLIERLGVRPIQGTHPLFQVMISAPYDENYDHSDLFESVGVQFDLRFLQYISTEPYYIRVDYASDIFDKNTCERLLSRYERLLIQVCQSSNKKLNELTLLLPEETALYNQINQTKSDIEDSQYVYTLILKQAQSFPDKIAVTLDNKSLTYKELIQRGKSFAALLRRKYEVKEGDVLIQCIERSIEMIIGMLGIIMSGAVYCPFHPDDPKDRLDLLKDKSKAKLIVTREILTQDFLDYEIDDRDITLYETKNCYLITTSGTTGTPKMISISHYSLYNFCQALPKTSSLWTEATVLQTSRCSFDVHIMECLVSLALGSTIVMLKEGGLIDLLYLLKTLQHNRVTVLPIVPSVLETISLFPGYESYMLNLRLIAFIGEPVHPQMVSRIRTQLPNIQIYNYYGPAETTIYSTFYEIKSDLVTIGVPMQNYKIKILNSLFQSVPLGTVGELYIGGLGVMTEYVNDPEKTKISLCEIDKEIFYKTGDLVKLNYDGLLTYVGRNDFQVKIRGQRLELSEIEHIIMTNPNIFSVIVTKREIKDQEYLVAYVVPKLYNEKTSHNLEQELKTLCKKVLPKFMIPSYWMMLPAFPLNVNGKIDRNELPIPVKQNNSKIVLPQTEIEHKLHEIWCKVFNRNQIGIHQDFFEDLGGNSFQMMNIFSLLQDRVKEINMSSLFEHSTICDLALSLSMNSLPSFLSWQIGSSLREEGPCSHVQRRILLDEIFRFSRSSSVYNIALCLTLPREERVLERTSFSLTQLASRHQILRTYFKEKGGQFFQLLSSPIDIVPTSVRTTLLELEHQIEIWTYSPINLFNSTSPTFHSILFECDDDFSYRLLLVFHHALFDGLSIPILKQEFFHFYNSVQPLPILLFQYLDFSLFEQDLIKTQELKDMMIWWKTVLKSVDSITEFPCDRKRLEYQSGEGQSILFFLNIELTQSILKYLNKLHLTTYMNLQFIISFLFAILTQQSFFIVGGIEANRYMSGTEQLIGMFANTLPFVYSIDTSLSFQDFLSHSRSNFIDVLKRSYVPFDLIFQQFSTTSLAGTPTLFQIMSLSSLEDDVVSTSRKVAKFDLQITSINQDSQIGLHLLYSTDLFDKLTCQRLADRLNLVYRQCFTKESSHKLCDINILLPDEISLYRQINNTTIDFGSFTSIPDLILSQGKNFPKKSAIYFNQSSLSYQELLLKAQQVSYVLHYTYYVRQGDIVVHFIDRSITMIVGILAILFCGAVYCPIHPDDPISRLETIIIKTKCKVVLSCKKIESILTSVFNIDIKKLQSSDPCFRSSDLYPESIAYIVHTSGSTGEPKGACITHAACFNWFKHLTTQLHFSPQDICLQFCRCSFDPHIREILITLMSGGSVVMLDPKQASNFSYIANTIVSNQVTRLYFTPSFFSEFYKVLDSFQHSLSSVTSISFGGEPLSKELILKSFSLGIPEVINYYGPAETTCDATIEVFHKDDLLPSVIPIGIPISNVQLFVLDSRQSQVPVESEGRLFIGGKGLMSGYIQDPKQTSQVLSYHEKYKCVLYDTGDIVKLLSNGKLVYIGRADSQIKFNGQRIDLSEIESVIQKNQFVENCVVIKCEKDNNSYLVAYVVTTQTIIDFQNRLKDHCKQHLPRYMIPSALVFLDQMPLSANGKIDRKALPEPSFDLQEEVQPRNNIEQQLHDLFCLVLNKTNISVTSDFFSDLNINSLTAMSLIPPLQNTFPQISVALTDLLENSSIETLAQWIMSL